MSTSTRNPIQKQPRVVRARPRVNAPLTQPEAPSTTIVNALNGRGGAAAQPLVA